MRRYQILRSFEESPQLPTGYAGMALLALFPPLWRYVMDDRVIAYNKINKLPTNKLINDDEDDEDDEGVHAHSH